MIVEYLANNFFIHKVEHLIALTEQLRPKELEGSTVPVAAENYLKFLQSFVSPLFLIQNVLIESISIDCDIDIGAIKLKKRFEMPLFSLKNCKKTALQLLHQEISSFYLAFLIDQMPKFAFIF